MAQLHENQNIFSTLELLQNDEAMRAPEPNSVPTVVASNFNDTPEVDSALLAPETLPGRDPEVLYTTLPPEAVDVDNTVDQPQASVRTSSSRRKTFTFAALVIFILIAVAIALGVHFRDSRATNSNLPATTRPSVQSSLVQHLHPQSPRKIAPPSRTYPQQNNTPQMAALLRAPPPTTARLVAPLDPAPLSLAQPTSPR